MAIGLDPPGKLRFAGVNQSMQVKEMVRQRKMQQAAQKLVHKEQAEETCWPTCQP